MSLRCLRNLFALPVMSAHYIQSKCEPLLPGDFVPSSDGGTCRYMRLLFCLAFVTLLLTGLVNIWGVPSINQSLMPQAVAAATTILEREVSLHC